MQFLTTVVALAATASAAPSLPLGKLNELTSSFLNGLSGLTGGKPVPAIPDFDLAPDTCALGLLSQPLCCQTMDDMGRASDCQALMIHPKSNAEFVMYCEGLQLKAACCAGTVLNNGAICGKPDVNKQGGLL